MSLTNAGAPLAFLKFYGSDFLNSTASWTMEERGVYMTLLWYAWVNDGLPPEVDRLDRMAAGTKSCWSVVGSKFPIAEDGLRRNPRMERDRQTLLVQLETWKARGTKGAAKRWSKDASSNALSIAQASPKQCLEDAQPIVCQISDVRYQISDIKSQISNSDKKHTLIGFAAEQDISPPRKKPASSISDTACESVWCLFPRRVGKKKAFILIRKAAAELAEEYEQDDPAAGISVLCERVQKFADANKTADPKFIAHPTTWLQQGRYLDPQEAL